MKTFYDCIPCFLRQALDVARMVTDDEEVHERIMRKVLRMAGEMDLSLSPPAMARRIHAVVREVTGVADAYSEVKDRFNRMALDILPQMQACVADSADPFETAVRLSIAGNVIDFGMRTDLDEAAVHEGIEHALAAPFDADLAEFKEVARQARNILYLADNAGEIVFDKLLIERIGTEKVTVAVRGYPIINDATMEDARAVGLTDMVEVIDSGSDAPGTILELCSESFQKRFKEADMVVAKGQGNYETLSEADRAVFFILKAKCPVIARDLGCPLGSLVLHATSRQTERR